MNRKKLLAQHTHCLALTNMHADEFAYRMELNHPVAVTNSSLWPIQAHLAEHDHILKQLQNLPDDES